MRPEFQARAQNRRTAAPPFFTPQNACQRHTAGNGKGSAQDVQERSWQRFNPQRLLRANRTHLRSLTLVDFCSML
jgi:hypothetical protein